MTTIVGRDRELERVDAFLADRSGAGCLVVLGEAGVGKTTIWRHGVEVARALGFVVLLSRPLELDMRIPFAGLHDLLSGVLDEVLDALPDPQRRALDAALLRSDPVGLPPEPGAIAFALLRGLDALACRAPVLIGIDDVQWLDEPSAVALRFALHRLDSAVVRLLAAQRIEGAREAAVGFQRVFEPGRFESIPLGPLSLGSIQHLLKEELAVEYPRPLLLKVHASSGGNAFFALELARAVERHGVKLEPGRPLPVPETLSDLVEERLAALAPAAQRGLEIAALLSDPIVSLVRVAADGEVDLAPQVLAGVAEVDRDRIRFTHPLLVSAVAARIGEERRRALHRRLAGLVVDPEERARHSALGASGADLEAAAALDEAARLASARGAPEVAAELLEQALAHTPEGAVQERARRLLATAEATHHAGDPERALILALQALGLLLGGHDRARALLLIGEIDSRIAALEEGVTEAGDDAQLRARVQIQLSECCFGRDLREALRHARAAAADASAAGDDVLLAQALTMQSWFEGATTTAESEATLALATRLEQGSRVDVRGDFTSAYTRATFALWRDEHALARADFESLRRRAEQHGRVHDQAHALLNLAQVEWRAGSWQRAADHVEGAIALWPRGDPSARALTLWIGAVLAGHRGQLDAARAAAEEGLAAAADHLLFRARNLWVIGLVALSAAQLDEALARLEEAAAVFDDAGAMEPGMRLFAPDLLDAYLAAGKLAEPEAMADRLLRQGQELGRPRATIIGGRGKGLVLAARGELEPALDTLTAAATAAERWPVPLEQGRTLIALGTVQRRARRRREARATLGRALQLFERLGAPVFTERARAELRRIAGRTPTGQSLTPTEQRIADLVARGLTNREVAAELIVAIHTVEAALTRIYSKLGVRSRSELTRHVIGQSKRGADAP